jgi:hypothetical protein
VVAANPERVVDDSDPAPPRLLPRGFGSSTSGSRGAIGTDAVTVFVAQSSRMSSPPESTGAPLTTWSINQQECLRGRSSATRAGEERARTTGDKL